jgi:hypothetical protein
VCRGKDLLTQRCTNTSHGKRTPSITQASQADVLTLFLARCASRSRLSRKAPQTGWKPRLSATRICAELITAVGRGGSTTMILTFQSGRDRSITCSVPAHRSPDACVCILRLGRERRTLSLDIYEEHLDQVPATPLAYWRSTRCCNVCHVQTPVAHPELRWSEHVSYS